LQSESIVLPRINQLDNRLANQIAAGEVVERPASVVKELLENSIDAGASRIEVDIERGGTRLIRITDNGCGIVKEDLNLALSRHATSKISSSDDLGAIYSLGFRGEALASIASVAKLTLTSRTADSDFAWQALAEGRDMSVKIQPASATVGTRIEVRELFYNTPARQKFLRAEKTEFAHIEEIFKRHALANSATAFILKHNHKVVRRIPAANKQADLLPRIEAICGKPFAQNAIAFDCKHELVCLKGWTGGVAYHRSESDIQYVFVNNRPVKDKMLNHAIRQAFQDRLPVGRMPTFVMFLTIDASAIDVNVHPTKHEIRFDQQRMIHDLIVHSIAESLKDAALPLQSNLANKDSSISQVNETYPTNHSSFRQPQVGVGYSQVKYREALSPNTTAMPNNTNSATSSNNHAISDLQLDRVIEAAKVSSQAHLNSSLCALDQQYLLYNYSNTCYVVDKLGFLKEWVFESLSERNNSESIELSEPLLFPMRIDIEQALLEQLLVNQILNRFGFNFAPSGAQQVELKQSPRWLRKVANEELSFIFVEWTKILNQHIDSIDAGEKTECAQQLTNKLEQYSAIIISNLLTAIENPQPLVKEHRSILELTDSVVSKLFEP
jgi:DNA mismatch repair protein MutL